MGHFYVASAVKALPCGEKMSQLDSALFPFGFRYEEKWDIITSGMYPWQRELGYCRGYDEAAPSMYMVIHSEPIYFDYGGRRWLLEFWKGQYGCTTGAEIGLYENRTAGAKERPEELFYECAADEDRINMRFTLWKDRKRLMERSALHWWLTGFAVGEYSEPEELKMEISLGFPDVCMRNACYRGMLRAGYRPEEIRMDGSIIILTFEEPRTEQPHYRHWLLRFVRGQNRRNCRLYRKASSGFVSTLDRITFLGYCFPCLYRKIIRLGVSCSREKLERCRKKSGKRR